MLSNGIFSRKEISRQDLSLNFSPPGPQQWLRVAHFVPYGRSSVCRKRTSEKSIAVPTSINREGPASEIENEASILYPSCSLSQLFSHDLIVSHFIILPLDSPSVSTRHGFSALCESNNCFSSNYRIVPLSRDCKSSQVVIL